MVRRTELKRDEEMDLNYDAVKESIGLYKELEYLQG